MKVILKSVFIFFLLLLSPLTSKAAVCDDFVVDQTDNVRASMHLLSLINNKCPEIEIKKSASLNDSHLINHKVKIEGFEQAVLTINESADEDAIVNFRNDEIKIKNLLIEVNNGAIYFTNTSIDDSLLYIKREAEFGCMNCSITGGKIDMITSNKSIFLKGKIGKGMGLANELDIINVTFQDTNNKWSEPFWLEVFNSDRGLIQKSEFVLESDQSAVKLGPAVKLEPTDNHPQNVIIKENNYIASSGSKINLEKIILVADQSPLSKLEKPHIEYNETRDDKFIIKISNQFTENSWGGGNTFTACDGGLDVEPYLAIARENASDEIVGLYPMEKIEEDSYELKTEDKELLIDKQLQVDISRLADPANLKHIQNKKVVLLFHCGGFGTTKFSNAVSLSISECSSDSDCPQDKVCQDGMCVISNEPPVACTSDAHCPLGQRCESGMCVGDANVCITSDNCGSGEFCDQGENVCRSCSSAPKVETFCPDDESIVKNNSVLTCSEGGEPFCKLNARLIPECGNICVCNDGSIPTEEGYCVDASNNAACPPGFEPNSNFTGCLDLTPSGSGGGGGCTLIRR